LKPKLPMLLGAAVVTLLALLGSGQSVHVHAQDQQTIFYPGIGACLEDHTTPDPNPWLQGDPGECDGDNTPGANSDFLTTFDVGPETACKNDVDDDGDGLVNDGCPVQGDDGESGDQCENAVDDDGDGWVNDGCPASQDVNFGAAVFFIPKEWGITPGDQIPIGTIVGQLTAQATLGLINNVCDNQLTVVFTMLNASTDPTDTVAFDDADDNGTGDVFEDKDNSGLQDGIEKYPEFITRIIGDAQPIRRSAGVEIIAGTDVLLQFLVFEPGTNLLSEIPSDADLGYPTMTFLQDVGDPDAKPEPNPITDFCSPLRANNLVFGISKDNPCTDNIPTDQLDPLCGAKSAPLDIPETGVSTPDESGIALYTNPEAGTYTFTTYALGQRDADNDGYENALDTCPYKTNAGNPRIKGSGDVDEDGLDAACDPNDNPDAGGLNSDQDADGYLNRQDNCPLVPNGEDADNQKDSDVNEQGDPRPDGIGDDCDQHPLVPDGEAVLRSASSELVIGGTPPPSSGSSGGGSSTTIIIIVVVVVAAVVVVGGGAFFVMRRRKST
jgi:hypothetical protein